MDIMLSLTTIIDGQRLIFLPQMASPRLSPATKRKGHHPILLRSLHSIIDQQREEAKVLDLTRNETVYFQELVQVETQREELRLKLRSLTSLESYLSRGVENTSIPPSAFLTQDPVAAEQVGQLYDLQLQRTQMLLDVTPSSFQVKRLDSLLSTTRLSLFDYIGGARGALEREAGELESRVNAIEAKLPLPCKSRRGRPFQSEK